MLAPSDMTKLTHSVPPTLQLSDLVFAGITFNTIMNVHNALSASAFARIKGAAHD